MTSTHKQWLMINRMCEINEKLLILLNQSFVTPPLRSIVDMMVTEVPPSIRFYHGKYIIAKLFQNTILFKACNGLPVILLSAGKIILILCNATISRNEGK